MRYTTPQLLELEQELERERQERRRQEGIIIMGIDLTDPEQFRPFTGPVTDSVKPWIE